MSPEQSNNPPVESKTLDKEDVIELLGEEAEEPIDLTPAPKKASPEIAEETAEEGTEEEPEVDELKEIEEELEEPSEEDLEIMTPVRRREILAKYPKLFKDFPYLEKAYYREQQFTELLPTIQDAKAAVEKARILDTHDRNMMNGDISSILMAVKQESQEAFYKVADNYLPALKQADAGAYYHVMGNVIKDTIITMVREAHQLGDQGTPLQAAANILNQFVFGTNTPQVPTPLSKRPVDNTREQEVARRERELVTRQFESTRDDLQSRADNTLKATIARNIDPRENMTDYVRETAQNKAFDQLEDLMEKDTRFRSLLDKLWEYSFKENFSKESQDRIKSAYLSKAKTLLPTVIKKARNDALRGLGKRVRDEEESTPSKGPIVGSKPRVEGKIKSAKDIPKGMSTLDVLNMD
jgi:hypothetical protein